MIFRPLRYENTTFTDGFVTTYCNTLHHHFKQCQEECVWERKRKRERERWRSSMEGQSRKKAEGAVSVRLTNSNSPPTISSEFRVREPSLPLYRNALVRKVSTRRPILHVAPLFIESPAHPLTFEFDVFYWSESSNYYLGSSLQHLSFLQARPPAPLLWFYAQLLLIAACSAAWWHGNPSPAEGTCNCIVTT